VTNCRVSDFLPMGAFDALAGRNPILPNDFFTGVKEGGGLKKINTITDNERKDIWVSHFCLCVCLCV